MRHERHRRRRARLAAREAAWWGAPFLAGLVKPEDDVSITNRRAAVFHLWLWGAMDGRMRPFDETPQ